MLILPSSKLVFQISTTEISLLTLTFNEEQYGLCKNHLSPLCRELGHGSPGQWGSRLRVLVFNENAVVNQ